MMRKLPYTILSVTALILVSIFVLPVVNAQGLVINPNDNPRCNDAAYRENHPDECINLGPIELPLFVSFEFIENFTIFSYLAVALNFLFLGVGLLWIILVVRAGIEYLRSYGDEGVIGASKKRISAVVASISMLFFSLVLLVLVGSFLGLGNFLSWPKKLSQCEDGTLYITKALELEAQNKGSQQVTEKDIDIACFN